MKRFFHRLLMICLCIISFYYIFFEDEMTSNVLKQHTDSKLQESKLSLQFKTVKEPLEEKDQYSLLDWMDHNATDLIQKLGDPNRQDLTPYGYTWWIYSTEDSYLQFGINDDQQIETIYARGTDLPIEDLKNKHSYDQINHLLLFDQEVTYNNSLSSYTFYLTDEDLLQRPLVHIEDDIFMQIYFDKFTNQLSSFRLAKATTLLKQIPYEVQYRGKLPETSQLTDQEWKEVEEGMEQQIFDLTNLIRAEHQLEFVQWENDLREVAFMHSKDMAENNYFSHYSPGGEGLKERLDTKNVTYQAAGENIAAEYIDGLAAVEGWVNSKGHRDALLDGNYTHLGVGVHRLYYTQNFISSRE